MGKSAPCGLLCAKKMPMKKHEMIYVFYDKLPLYDIRSHRHKFLDGANTFDRHLNTHRSTYGNNKRDTINSKGEPYYDPPLPTSILTVSSERGKHRKHNTQTPIELMKWILKYDSK